MGWERTAGSVSRIVLVVIGEYALSVTVFFLLIRSFGLGGARLASFAAAFFALLTLLNLLAARRVFRRRVDPETRRHLVRLRDDLRFLHWYVDDVWDRAGVGLLVLDPSLRVRAVNEPALRFLSIEGKERLVGRSFRSQPMAGSVDSSTGGGGEPLLRVLERCAREGGEASLRDLSPRPGSGSEGRVHVDIHPWREPGRGARRLIVVMTPGSPPSSAPPEPPPKPAPEEPLVELAALRDYLGAMLAGCRESGKTRSPETLLLEMQAKGALRILDAVERGRGKGVS